MKAGFYLCDRSKPALLVEGVGALGTTLQNRGFSKNKTALSYRFRLHSL